MDNNSSNDKDMRELTPEEMEKKAGGHDRNGGFVDKGVLVGRLS